MVSLGRPYLAAAAALAEASDGLPTVFFGMGDETFGGEDGAGAGGDDGAAFLRGMDANTSGFGVAFSCFTATGAACGSTFGVSGVETGSVLMAATNDFVIWVEDFLGTSSVLAFSSSLSANKSSSSSLSAGGAETSFSSVDMVKGVDVCV